MERLLTAKQNGISGLVVMIKTLTLWGGRGYRAQRCDILELCFMVCMGNFKSLASEQTRS